MNLMARFIAITSLLIVWSFALFACKNGDNTKSNLPNESASSSSSAASSSSNVNSSRSSVAATELSKKIDDYLLAHQAADLAGVSVLVEKNGQVVYSGGRGMADIESGVSITSTTGFRLASVSKPFTAIAVMQLVERGDLKVSDSLLDYIPELPSSWRKITIQQLLSHRSGIPDIINDGWHPDILNGLTHARLISYLIKNPRLEFEPGTQFDYSNTGYMLLATLIERKTGLSFPEYMQSNIFGPANMKGSYINDENQPIKYGDALNYARFRTYYGLVTYLKGSMAQVSSRDDFLNFFLAMRENKLISAQTLAEMSVARSFYPGNKVGYGYGFGVSNDYISHQGEWDGFETEMAIKKAQDIAFVILTNSGSVGRGHANAIRAIIYTTSF